MNRIPRTCNYPHFSFRALRKENLNSGQKERKLHSILNQSPLVARPDVNEAFSDCLNSACQAGYGTARVFHLDLKERTLLEISCVGVPEDFESRFSGEAKIITNSDPENNVAIFLQSLLSEKMLAEKPLGWKIETARYFTVLRNIDARIDYIAVPDSQNPENFYLFALSNVASGRIPFSILNRLGSSFYSHEKSSFNFALSEKQKITDSLTQIPSRRYLDAGVEKILAEIRRSSDEETIYVYMMLDVDHFRDFNNNYGHQTGDVVLQLVAHAIEESVRKNDIVARFGGDEIAVVAGVNNIKGALVLAERIRKNVENLRVLAPNEQELNVTISIGVALYKDSDNHESWQKRADDAAFHSKNSGRNCVSFYG